MKKLIVLALVVLAVIHFASQAVTPTVARANNATEIALEAMGQ